eukprot:8669125-Pyramimonas_sp.AAC.1
MFFSRARAADEGAKMVVVSDLGKPPVAAGLQDGLSRRVVREYWLRWLITQKVFTCLLASKHQRLPRFSGGDRTFGLHQVGAI